MSHSYSYNEAFFRRISHTDIDKNLALLRKRLPAKPTKKNYQLSPWQLGLKRKIDGNNLQSVLQEAADIIRGYLDIEKPIKIVTIDHIDAGKFEQIGDLNCIYINGSFANQSFEQKVAILAHEMSHYYLIYRHKIFLSNQDENELLTEINAVYIGLGLLLLNGYGVFKRREGNKVFQSKVGYVDLNVVRKTIVKTANLRKQNPIWILQNVNLVNAIYFAIKLYNLILQYLSVKYAHIGRRMKRLKERWGLNWLSNR